MGGRAGAGGSLGGGGGTSAESFLLAAVASFAGADVLLLDEFVQWENAIAEAVMTSMAASFWSMVHVYVCGKIRYFLPRIVKPSEKMVVYSQTFLTASLLSFAAQEQPICTALRLSLSRKD